MNLVLHCELTFISFYKSISKLSTSVAMPRYYYAVRNGRETGVFDSWNECETQVKGFKNSAYKKFSTESEARSFANAGSSTSTSNSNAASSTSHSYGASSTAQSFQDSTDYSSSSMSSLLSNVPKFIPSEYQSSHVQSSSSSCHKPSFYAVHKGREPGVYHTWSDCEVQTKGFQNPSYRKFRTLEEASNFAETGNITEVGGGKAKQSQLNEGLDYFPGHEVQTTTHENKVYPHDTVTVFTDGASADNGKVTASAGIGVYWGPDHPLNTSMRLPGRQTNNRAEIFAATHALRQAKQVGAKNVQLYTDSKFLINGITDWIHKWKNNDWKLSSGQPVKNKEDFVELDKACQGLKVDWKYIKAHDNNPGNDEADRLAVAGAKKSLAETELL